VKLIYALSLSLLLLTSPVQAAEDYELKVGGTIKAYAGRYDSGIEGEKAYLVSPTEVNLQVTATRGPIEAFFELEQRQQVDKTVTKRSLRYNQETWQLIVGTVAPIESLGYTYAGGTKTSSLTPYGFYTGYIVWAEWDGIGFRYRPSKALNLGISLYSADILNSETSAAGYPTKRAGYSNMFSGRGSLTFLEYRFSMLSSTTDDHQGGDTLSHSGNYLGLKKRLGGFTAILDLTQKKIQSNLDTAGEAVSEYNKVTNEAAVQGGYRLSNGDDLALTLALVEKEHQLEIASSEQDNYVNLVYNYNLVKDAVIQFAYGRQSKTQGDVPLGIEHKRSFLGLGIYSKF